MKYLRFSQTKLGSSLLSPAHGWAGAMATSFLAAHFAKRNMKFGGGGTPEAIPLWRDATGQEARAGKNFYPVGSRSNSFGAFPPTPFLFARPSVPPSGVRRSKFSVRIFAKKSSDFVQGVEQSRNYRGKNFGFVFICLSFINLP